MDRLLTTNEIAERLAVPVETVRYWRKCRRGPRALKIGRAVRYRESDLLLWLAERTEPVHP